MAVRDSTLRSDRDADTSADADADDHARSTKAFSASIVISAIRCTLTYVVFPWVLPVVGVAGGVGPVVGVVIGVIAIASNLASIRRFWSSRHRWRWPVTVINVGVIALLSVLLWQDLTDL